MTRPLTLSPVAGAMKMTPPLRAARICPRSSVVVQANLFSRVGRIFKSYANSVGTRLPLVCACILLERSAGCVSARAARVPRCSCGPSEPTIQSGRTPPHTHVSWNEARTFHPLPSDCVLVVWLEATNHAPSALLTVSLVHKSAPSQCCPAAVSSAEDPEKILDQAVTDMNNDLIRLRQATAKVCRCASSGCNPISMHGQHFSASVIWLHSTHLAKWACYGLAPRPVTNCAASLQVESLTFCHCPFPFPFCSPLKGFLKGFLKEFPVFC